MTTMETWMDAYGEMLLYPAGKYFLKVTNKKNRLSFTLNVFKVNINNTGYQLVFGC